MTLLRYFNFAILVSFFCGAFICAQTTALAQSESELTKTTEEVNSSVTQKKQSIDFEDELVVGTAQTPEAFHLFQKKNFNYKRLITLRENFIPEMRRSAEDIKRLRGGN